MEGCLAARSGSRVMWVTVILLTLILHFAWEMLQAPAVMPFAGTQRRFPLRSARRAVSHTEEA